MKSIEKIRAQMKAAVAAGDTEMAELCEMALSVAIKHDQAFWRDLFAEAKKAKKGQR